MCKPNQSNDVVCPTCGTCPTCGKKVWDYTYYYTPYRPDPTWQYTTWSSGHSGCEEDKQDGK